MHLNAVQEVLVISLTKPSHTSDAMPVLLYMALVLCSQKPGWLLIDPR